MGSRKSVLDISLEDVTIAYRKAKVDALRAPYKEAYMRDVVRIRGGEFDYFVLATLDVEGLRQFQKRNPSPKEPFKPTPTGYKISKDRREF